MPPPSSILPCLQVHVPCGAANSKKVEENVRSLEEEVQLLQQFDHPNIVRYLVRMPPGHGALLMAWSAGAFHEQNAASGK